jgi:hypothetical protein
MWTSYSRPDPKHDAMTYALKLAVRRAEVETTKALLARGANPFVLDEEDIGSANSNSGTSLLRLIGPLDGKTARIVKAAKRAWINGPTPRS